MKVVCSWCNELLYADAPDLQSAWNLREFHEWQNDKCGEATRRFWIMWKESRA